MAVNFNPITAKSDSSINERITGERRFQVVPSNITDEVDGFYSAQNTFFCKLPQNEDGKVQRTYDGNGEDEESGVGEGESGSTTKPTTTVPQLPPRQSTDTPVASLKEAQAIVEAQAKTKKELQDQGRKLLAKYAEQVICLREETTFGESVKELKESPALTTEEKNEITNMLAEIKDFNGVRKALIAGFQNKYQLDYYEAKTLFDTTVNAIVEKEKKKLGEEALTMYEKNYDPRKEDYSIEQALALVEKQMEGPYVGRLSRHEICYAMDRAKTTVRREKLGWWKNFWHVFNREMGKSADAGIGP